MIKTATKPAKLVTQTDEDHADDTLVEDHGIDNLVLHQDFDGKQIVYSGTITLDTHVFGFECSFMTHSDPSKEDVRAQLIQSARYVDDSDMNGKQAPNHLAMNRTFKALLKRIMTDVAEQADQ